MSRTVRSPHPVIVSLSEMFGDRVTNRPITADKTKTVSWKPKGLREVRNRIDRSNRRDIEFAAKKHGEEIDDLQMTYPARVDTVLPWCYY